MVNRAEIKDSVKKVIQYSQGIEDPQVDELLDNWLEAKRDFIELFNGELIWEYPEKITFEIGPKERSLRVNDFIDLVRGTYGNAKLADFISENKDGFFSNKVLNNYRHECITINQGMKLLKAFKFFEEDPVVLNKLQSAASMIIQENKIEGTLCLSVHPLDYLSLSENNHNWRSCHALDGEYRAGNLSYMQDSSTLICYLRSNNMEVLPNFPDELKWNSKKWRMLLFFSDTWDLMFAGRQYPFSTTSGLDFVKNNLLPAVGLDHWSPWTDEKITRMENADMDFYFSSPYIPIGKKLRPLNEVIVDAKGSLHYNDLLHSTCYTPVYSYRVRGDQPNKSPIIMKSMYSVTRADSTLHIGHSSKCLLCGQNNISLTESMMCEPCDLEYGTEDNENYGTCSCCGHRFIYDDGGWVEDPGEMICQHCFDEYTSSCYYCGENYYTDDMVYDRKQEGYICKYCREENGINIQEEEE